MYPCKFHVFINCHFIILLNLYNMFIIYNLTLMITKIYHIYNWKNSRIQIGFEISQCDKLWSVLFRNMPWSQYQTNWSILNKSVSTRTLAHLFHYIYLGEADINEFRNISAYVFTNLISYCCLMIFAWS